MFLTFNCSIIRYLWKATVRALTGSEPKAYVGDSTTPDAVRTRTLTEETARVFRARVVNPRWIAAMRLRFPSLH